MLAAQAARSLCVLFLAIATTGGIASQGECDLPEFMVRADIPGLGMAEVRGDHIDLSHYGYARSPDACVTESTVFEAASLTKPVVAYLVMRLVDKGRLGLDDALIERLPTLPLPQDDPRSGRVTIRMALSHSTGLQGSDEAELVFANTPGATFEYYPAGYRLVQRIVEHVEAATLEEVAQREVFEPLGMHSSSLIFREDLLARTATRHRMLGEPFDRTRDPQRPPNAAASLITTPEDYARFLQAVLSGDGLSQQARNTMFAPQIDVPDTDDRVAWGVGWGIEPGRGTFFHWGDDGAAKAFTIGAVDQDRAIVYFANSFYGMAIAREIADRLLPGESPAVEWLGYEPWDSPKRLLRRDSLRDFVEGNADLGMDTFERYAHEYPEIDLEEAVAFLSWVLEGRGKHAGRARLLAWQIERTPDKVDLYFNLSRSLQAMNEYSAAIETLEAARAFADGATAELIGVRQEWMTDEVLEKENESANPTHASSALAGAYGEWRVLNEDDGLVFEPGGGSRYTMRWMHGATYALDTLDWFRLRFTLKDGKASKVTGRYSDGRTEQSVRAVSID